jgi:trans-aconitate methyltransferase
MIIEDMKYAGYRSVLDIGCGNGRFLEESLKRNFIPTAYLGVDDSIGMVSEAKKLHPHHQFEVIPMENLPSGL